MNRTILKTVLFLNLITLCTLSIFPASTDIKSEKLIEDILNKKYEKWYAMRIDENFSEVLYLYSENEYIVPLREHYREKILTYSQTIGVSPASISRMISSKYWIAQAMGIYLAVIQGEKGLIPQIKETLESSNQYVKFNAIKALCELDKSLKSDFFLAILKNSKEEPYPRAAAIAVLTPIIKKDIYLHIKDLQGKDNSLDYYIAWALGEINTPEAYSLLLSLRPSHDYMVLKATYNSMRKISNLGVEIAYSPSNELYDSLQSDTESFIDHFGAKYVRDALFHKNNVVRKNAIIALEGKYINDFKPDLMRLINDDNWEVEREAIFMLAKIDSEDVKKEIIKKFKSPRASIRKTALWVAMESNDKDYEKYTFESLKDTNYDIRYRVVQYIMSNPSAEAIPHLREAFALESYIDLQHKMKLALKKCGWQPETDLEKLFD
ncbi:MAG: HEAT repeat domain-containing protein [Acidobacteria bacterium]|nr:HEAT repeat domain-containing protein [Acidobacteriota bacterium]